VSFKYSAKVPAVISVFTYAKEASDPIHDIISNLKAVPERGGEVHLQGKVGLD
jgi:hypothetical protein